MNGENIISLPRVVNTDGMKILKTERFLCVAEKDDKIYRFIIHQNHHKKYNHEFTEKKFSNYLEALEANLFYALNLKQLNRITTNVPRFIDSYFLENKEVHVLVMSKAPGLLLSEIHLDLSSLPTFCRMLNFVERLWRGYGIYIPDLHSENVFFDESYADFCLIDFETKLNEKTDDPTIYQEMYSKLEESFPVLVRNFAGYDDIKRWSDLIKVTEGIIEVLYRSSNWDFGIFKIPETLVFNDPYMAMEYLKTRDFDKAVKLGNRNYGSEVTFILDGEKPKYKSKIYKHDFLTVYGLKEKIIFKE